jgi:hypothetical protein
LLQIVIAGRLLDNFFSSVAGVIDAPVLVLLLQCQ